MTPPADGRPYADPYVAGVALGLVLLGTFALCGRGLGASGAFATLTAEALKSGWPDYVNANAMLGRYAADGGPWSDWLVLELSGVVIGGGLSAWQAGRLRWAVERGPASIPVRIALAFAGGLVMGGGAVLARGCTSGLALTGGALLAAGSWLFTLTAFAAAYAVAALTRRAWR